MIKEYCDKCGEEIADPTKRVHVIIFVGQENRTGLRSDKALCSDCGKPFLELAK